jgi:hypothetical protein
MGWYTPSTLNLQDFNHNIQEILWKTNSFLELTYKARCDVFTHTLSCTSFLYSKYSTCNGYVILMAQNAWTLLHLSIHKIMLCSYYMLKTPFYSILYYIVNPSPFTFTFTFSPNLLSVSDRYVVYIKQIRWPITKGENIWSVYALHE